MVPGLAQRSRGTCAGGAGLHFHAILHNSRFFRSSGLYRRPRGQCRAARAGVEGRRAGDGPSSAGLGAWARGRESGHGPLAAWPVGDPPVCVARSCTGVPGASGGTGGTGGHGRWGTWAPGGSLLGRLAAQPAGDPPVCAARSCTGRRGVGTEGHLQRLSWPRGLQVRLCQPLPTAGAVRPPVAKSQLSSRDHRLLELVCGHRVVARAAAATWAVPPGSHRVTS